MQAFKENVFTNLEKRAPTTTPYSPEFISFITESRQQQTLLANSLGNSKAAFNTDDRKSLEEFLSVSLFHFQLDQHKRNCAENEKEIQLIADKILKSFHGGQQRLQLSLIWIFYYSPNENQTNYLPAFKITNMHGLGTKYMDISFTFFDTWTGLLENVQVGNSFLCIPRDGVYRSEELVLDLEYMWSRPSLNKRSHVQKKFKPFIISFVKNWLMVNVQKLGDIFSKAVKAAIAFYKDHYSEVNIIIVNILALAVVYINPESQVVMYRLQTLLTTLFKVGTTSRHEVSDGRNAEPTAQPTNQQESIKKFVNVCDNVMDFSKICMNAYKKRLVDIKSVTDCFEILSLILKDVKSLSKDLIVPSWLEKITEVTINKNGKFLENLIQNGNGTGLSESHILSPCNMNRNWQKYSVCTYHGSDFTEVQKMALCLFKRNLKFEKKSNKLFDFSGKHIGYVYFLPDITFCVYLSSEIALNERENFTFTVIND